MVFIRRVLIYYSFIIVTVMSVVGFTNAENIPQIISAAIFFPLMVYFFLQILPKRSRALRIEPIVVTETEVIAPKAIRLKNNHRLSRYHQPLELEIFDQPSMNFDNNRRAFIKLIGSAGLGLFFFSLFSQKAHGAFFGSVPGPGTVALKDPTGTQIDPARNQPTDGYKIAQLDDSAPAYYGYLDKDGNWFILKVDDTTGEYRYTKGASNFSTNWTGRAGLTYALYDSVF